MIKQAKKKLITKIHTQNQIGKIPLRVYFRLFFLFIFGALHFIFFILECYFHCCVCRLQKKKKNLCARAFSLSLCVSVCMMYVLSLAHTLQIDSVKM